MPNEKESKFARYIAILGTVFEKNGLNKAKIGVYYHYLQDLSEEQLKRAVDKIVLTRRYQSMPTPAEIRQSALDLLSEDIEIEAAEAWPRANQGLVIFQRGDSPNDPVVEEAVRIAFGGWKLFGETDTTYDARDRARFIEAYKIAAARMTDQRALLREFAENRRRLNAIKPKQLESKRLEEAKP
jgi:hypothetical protein